MKKLIFILSIFILFLAPTIGQIDIAFSNLFDKESMHYQVFWDIRVPRVILAFFTGAILATGGLIFQSVFRNPMGTPFTLGVASGATLFTAIGIILGLSIFIPLFAFVGAVFTIFILFLVVSRFKSYDTSSLLLVGIALSFFYSASLMVMFFISDLNESYEIVRFTMGSLSTVGYTDSTLIAIASLFMLVLIYRYKSELKLLLTSYQFAKLKGVNVKRVNYILLFSVSIGVGVAVSITGPIGFVGLIIPHILKTIYQQSNDKLILPTFFYGGVFLVFCDILARKLGVNSDIPIGVITSFIGAPFFIYLIIKRKKGN
jgi:iron complex transport system permease protein